MTLLVPALALLLQAGAAPAAPDPLPDQTPEVRAGELEQLVRFLSADELRGRAVGTEEARRAARYLARVLEAAGLEPGAPAGGFLQAVPLERLEHASPPRLRLVDRDGDSSEARYGTDFMLWRSSVPTSTGPLPLAEEPPADGAARVAVTRGRAAREPGVGLAVLTVEAPTDPPGAPPAPLVVAGAEHRAPVVLLFGDLAERLDAGELATAELVVDLRVVPVEDYNVVARIDGVGTPEEPELAREAVVVSAHYDHIGVRADAAEDEDGVYNGADDDASGVACVVELAAALAAGEPPARTLVFLLATGEERGLLGTDHYLEHPAVPLAATVLNLNFEMIGRPDPLSGGSGWCWLTGFELTNLGPAFVAEGLRVAADPRPEQHFFERSDNIAFVRRGIVGQSLSSYGMHTDYHETTDEADTLDYEHLETVARTALAALELVANGVVDPVWSSGAPPR